jgi:hypothetical protein
LDSTYFLMASVTCSSSRWGSVGGWGGVGGGRRRGLARGGSGPHLQLAALQDDLDGAGGPGSGGEDGLAGGPAGPGGRRGLAWRCEEGRRGRWALRSGLGWEGVSEAADCTGRSTRGGGGCVRTDARGPGVLRGSEGGRPGGADPSGAQRLGHHELRCREEFVSGECGARGAPLHCCTRRPRPRPEAAAGTAGFVPEAECELSTISELTEPNAVYRRSNIIFSSAFPTCYRAGQCWAICQLRRSPQMSDAISILAPWCCCICTRQSLNPTGFEALAAQPAVCRVQQGALAAAGSALLPGPAAGPQLVGLLQALPLRTGIGTAGGAPCARRHSWSRRSRLERHRQRLGVRPDAGPAVRRGQAGAGAVGWRCCSTCCAWGAPSV